MKEVLHWHHIVPKYEGGSDSPENLKRLTISCHAEEHRKLYEKNGKREDWLAWHGLLKLITKKDILLELCSHKGENNPMYGRCGPLHHGFGKKRPEHSELMKMVMKGKKKSVEHQTHWNESFRKRSKINPVASRKWDVLLPTGERCIVSNIAQFCRENALNKSSVSMAAKNGKSYKGYRFTKL